MIFEGNDRAVTPSFPYLLSKVNDLLLTCFHYLLPMFQYSSWLISVLVFLQNYSSLLVVRSLPLYVGRYPYTDNIFSLNGTRVPTDGSSLPKQ